MEFKELQERALDLRKRFAAFEEKKFGRSWTKEELALGFIGDVGDLAKLLLAQEGVRDIPDAKEKLAHELSDCLWSIIVLAKLHDIELEGAYLATMQSLEEKLNQILDNRE